MSDDMDIWMKQRLPTCNGDNGCAALFNGSHALLDAKMPAQNLVRISYLSTALAAEIASEQGFQHQDEWKPPVARKLLPGDVGADPRLLDPWYAQM